MLREVGSDYLGRYRIAKVLSAKGMSFVYICVDTNLNKLVCLKEVSKSNVLHLESLYNEIQILSSLHHYGIPDIIDVHEDSERVSLLMEFIAGGNFESLLKTNPHGLDENFAVSKMLQLALILGYLHSRPSPVFYRDLKPANIILQDNNVRLLDFGISLPLTETSVIDKALGTKGYAAPEQALEGAPCDLRSDIYSFGVTLFNLLTGVSPAQARGDYVLTHYKPLASKGLESLILKCVEPSPDKRYQSFAEVLVALKSYHFMDDSYIRKAKKRIGLTRALWVLGVMSLVAAGGTYYLSSRMAANTYQHRLEVARQSSSTKDFITAIATNPEKIDPYFELVETYKKAKFTAKDEKSLLDLLKPNLTVLRQSTKFPALSLEIGKLYWFFYESPEQGKILSIPWFETAGKDGENFYRLGVFHRDLTSKIETASDKGIYKDAWNVLQSLIDSQESESKVLKYETYLYGLQFLHGYLPQLKTDGVPRKSVEQMLEKIKLGDETNQKLKSIIEEINTLLPSIRSSIEVTYG